jgi:asparagine synthase (glutamine-hydrolysing)
MCGIAGQARCDGRAVDQALLERMCEALKHRGPDSRGIHRENGVGLSIQRLAVIDLKSGDQPIYNEDRSVAVVLNGEIYNFQELRRELEAKGHSFRTQGDTEVIAHLYEEDGVDCVRRLHGMFAFAIWDASNKRLCLARDRLGKKPLLYAQRGEALSFASEMASLLQDPEVPREVDPEAIDAFLAFQYIPAPLTAFTSVRKLPPATTMVWQGGQVELSRYWNLTYRPKQKVKDVRDTYEQIREHVMEAVRRRLISDVPLGAFLSGGVDSSAVVAAMAQLSSQPVKTYSIGFEDSAFNELPRARKIAERYATDHHELIVEPKALELIPKIVQHYGEPFGDTSSVPSFLVSDAASQHVTVALNGDGGDENFGGYHHYVANLTIERFAAIPRPLRKAIGAMGAATREQGPPRKLLNRARRFAKQLAMSGSERHQHQMSHQFRERIYSDQFRQVVSDYTPLELLAQSWRDGSGTDLVDLMLEVDVNTILPDDLLPKIDIATMAYGLEARSPLLDHELMEFAATLPTELKIRGTETKVAFREALRPWVPSEILDGPKGGFNLPVVTSWFRGHLRGWVEDILLDRRAIDRGYFRESAIRQLIEEHGSGKADNSQALWQLVMLEMWHREFVDQAPRAQEPSAIAG